LVQRVILLLVNAMCHGLEDVLRTDDGNFTVHYFPPRTTDILKHNQKFETKVQTETSIRIVIYGGKWDIFEIEEHKFEWYLLSDYRCMSAGKMISYN